MVSPNLALLAVPSSRSRSAAALLPPSNLSDRKKLRSELRFLLGAPTSTSNSALTGRWSDSRDSHRSYRFCFSPAPRHSIRSHLKRKKKKNGGGRRLAADLAGISRYFSRFSFSFFLWLTTPARAASRLSCHGRRSRSRCRSWGSTCTSARRRWHPRSSHGMRLLPIPPRFAAANYSESTTRSV